MPYPSGNMPYPSGNMRPCLTLVATCLTLVATCSDGRQWGMRPSMTPHVCMPALCPFWLAGFPSALGRKCSPQAKRDLLGQAGRPFRARLFQPGLLLGEASSQQGHLASLRPGGPAHASRGILHLLGQEALQASRDILHLLGQAALPKPSSPAKQASRLTPQPGSSMDIATHQEGPPSKI